MKHTKLDRYVSTLDMSSKRADNSGIRYQKRSSDNDSDFRGFKRVNDARSTITYGHNAQRTGDANKFKSVESGTTRTSMSVSGCRKYSHEGSSGSSQAGTATKGSKGSW